MKSFLSERLSKNWPNWILTTQPLDNLSTVLILLLPGITTIESHLSDFFLCFEHLSKNELRRTEWILYSLSQICNVVLSKRIYRPNLWKIRRIFMSRLRSESATCPVVLSNFDQIWICTVKQNLCQICKDIYCQREYCVSINENISEILYIQNFEIIGWKRLFLYFTNF